MSRNNFKTRNFLLELYPDNSKHQSAFDFIIGSDWQYVYIKHHIIDLDGNDIVEGEGKPHYHMIVKFDNPVYASALAKRLGLVTDIGDVDLQFIQPVKRMDDALLYLTHIKYEDKEHYSPDELHGSASLIKQYHTALYHYVEDKRVTVRDFFGRCKTGSIPLGEFLIHVIMSIFLFVLLISVFGMRDLH